MVQETLEATNWQAAEPIIYNSKKQDNFNKLADCVVSEERPALGGHLAKKEKSILVKAAGVKDVIAGIPSLNKNALPTMMVPAQKMQAILR